MNTALFKSLGRQGSILSAWFCLTLFPLLSMATDPIYISPATVGNPAPNVDATNFYNGGTWNIFTYPLRYETKNTLNYTNNGTMTGSPGWEFDFGSGSSGRTWSANFLNNNGATITENDVTITTGLSQGELVQQEGWLWVLATNIVNKGLMSAGAGGEIVLNGSTVNLSHSAGLQILPIVGTGGFNGQTNYIPDTAIYSEYWEATNGNLTVGGSPWDGTTLGAFVGYANEPCGVVDAPIQIGPLTPNVVDSVTNALGLGLLTLTNQQGLTSTMLVSSNLYYQGVFVYTGTNNLTGQIRFLSTGSLSNGFDIVSVQLGAAMTNVVTAQVQTDAVYFVDDYAASTNHGLNPDSSINPGASCNSLNFRPAAYNLTRIVPIEYSLGFSPGLGVPPPSWFYNPSYTNYIVTGGDSAAWSALVDNVAAQIPPGGSVTNLPGRVHIYANNLNLNQAHVRAEGQIIVRATNLVTSVNAIMDCQNLSYNLGATNGSLNFTNLALPVVSRLHGTCDMVTAVWSNLVVTIYPNFVVSNGVVTGESDITNVTLVNLSLTAVDASGLLTTVPVTVQDLVLHSTNMIVSDSVTVDETLLLDGLSATLVGDVALSGALQNWTYVNAPTLSYFTNNGALSIPNSAHFGDDGPNNYLWFVNNGSINSGGQNINSVNLLVNNGGVNFCNSGGFVGVAQTVQLTGATIEAQSDIQFFANNLQLNAQSTLDTVLGALDLTVTNSLTDGGAGAGNTINCQNGFNLFRKPTKGDLLGTAINSYCPLNAEVDHYWAGVDRGVSAAGYVNNVSIGSLALIPQGTQSSLYQPLFAFFPATGANALYVSTLDLSSLSNYFGEIAIDPNMAIYYVTAMLNSTNASQFLDGMQFLDVNGNPGGKMHWVAGGPSQSRSATYGTMTGSYNAANGHFQLIVANSAGPTNFVIQASTDLKNWVPIYTNNGPFGFYIDPTAGGYSHRFYRTAPGH
jgi:hypothetical protein